MQETADIDEVIRLRAYTLWEEAGRPEDRHEEFWHQAKAEHASTLAADTEPTQSDDPTEVTAQSHGPKIVTK